MFKQGLQSTDEVSDDYGKKPSGRSDKRYFRETLPGDITFYRLQSTSDNKIRAYVAQGEVLPVATRSFGSIGVFAIPEMGRFYRHVLIEKNYPHHGAVAFGHYGKALFEVFKYLGVPMEDINYNQPASLPYPTENPFCIKLHKLIYYLKPAHLKRNILFCMCGNGGSGVKRWFYF